MLPDPPFTAIILAAQRKGVVNPLALAADVSHKCLVPVGGVPMIRHVVATLARMPGLHRLRIVVEPEATQAVTVALKGIDAVIDFVPSADNLADSVTAGTAGVDGVAIVTTADNVLLTRESVGAVLRAFEQGADGAIALATRQSVITAHPDGQRRFYRFADDFYSNCNLYAVRGTRALDLVESFRTGGNFHRKPLRLLTTFGVFNLGLMRLGWLSLGGAARRISRRFGIHLAAVVLPDGSQAIDVDNPRSHAIVEQLLVAR